ncbi:MAG: DNA translocase FtsK 4TM domain-containing protein, partial [Pseudomonadota bacterium]
MAWATATARSARKRPPLFEEETRAFLARRGSEGLGALLALAGLAALLTVQTYSPEDPSIFSATDAAPQNALGLIGASIADPLVRATGWAANGVGLVLLVWGARLMLHRGEERVLSRLILAPIAIALAAVLAAAHVPPPTWGADYGLGGVLGDSALAAIIGQVPLPLGPALTVVTLALAVIAGTMALLALGVDGAEFASLLRYLWQGLVLAFAVSVGALAALTRGGAAAARSGGRAAGAGARRLARDQADRRATRAERRQEPVFAAEIDTPPGTAADAEAVMARISAAVRARD